MDFSSHLVLENSRVRLRPLEASDFAVLKEVAADPALWQYSLTAAHSTVELAGYLRRALRERELGRRYPFVIVDRGTGQLAGSTSYYHVRPDELRLSIGHTWVGRDFQRTGLNRAAKHLLLCHAFGQLACQRVELETDARNWLAREALRRMGATEEGTLRSHRFTQGGRRCDTVIYSVLRPEWDQLRQTIFREFDARG